MDSDTFAHPNTPNFFELSENKFCGVSVVGSMDWIIRSIENYSHHLFDGFTFPYYRYINSGFMIFNKDHKKLFKEILDFYFNNQEKNYMDAKESRGRYRPTNYQLLFKQK